MNTTGKDTPQSVQAAPYLTFDQISLLNKRHGWFRYGDSQGEVSQAFAQDAIEMYLKAQAAQPKLRKIEGRDDDVKF